MRSSRPRLGCLAVVLATALPAAACGPNVAANDGDGQDEGDAASEGDPTVSEDDGGGGDANPYDRCNFDFYFAPVECSGAHGGTAPDACAACLCGVGCSRDSDCPQPSTGNVDAECIEEACMLSCDGDAVCPDGMRCGTRNWDGRATCVEALDDPLACHVSLNNPDWPDPCAPQSDKQSCEALVSEYGFACKWATQSLFQLPSDDCTPLETVESCVLAERTGSMNPAPLCEAVGYCESAATRVLVEDFGGGTMRLVSIEACELSPVYSNLGMGFAYCSFDDGSPTPEICACACPASSEGTSG